MTACDTPLRGRITMAYGKQNGTAYFRVQFPARSPFLDDWAVYREHELTRRKDPPKTETKQEAYDDGFPKNAA